MAILLATAKRKNGDELYLKTSVPQVVGLTDALAAKQAQLTQAQLDAVNSGATAEQIAKIAANESAISDISDLIPGQATGANQLADKGFVNSSIQTMSADLISYNAAGDPFPTKAALDSATTFYNGGVEKTPDENDYCTVLADETHGGAQTRYTFSGSGWAFQFLVNDTPFTAAQNAAINSGITVAKVAQYDELAADMGDYLTKTEAGTTYAQKAYVEGLGTVYFVAPGADLSGFKDSDLIIELEAE